MAKPNLFLQSFKHLERQKERTLLKQEATLQAIENLSAQDNMPVGDTEPVGRELRENKKNSFAIYLGKGQVFLDPIVAYQHLLQNPVKDVPARYRNTLTGAFFNGTETGQINSLFKDWKKYKGGILPKIQEYFEYVKKTNQAVIGKQYVTNIIANYTPVSPETFVDGAVDLNFFKFWALFKFYVSAGQAQ